MKSLLLALLLLAAEAGATDSKLQRPKLTPEQMVARRSREDAQKSWLGFQLYCTTRPRPEPKGESWFSVCSAECRPGWIAVMEGPKQWTCACITLSTKYVCSCSASR